jgi:hypothetical protein
MINPNEKEPYYLYRHLRINPHTLFVEVFYVGRGTICHRKKGYKGKFARAYSKNDRTQLWRNVAGQGHVVEIMITSSDKEFIENKEMEFIALYGRRILETGPLVNVRAGGPSDIGDARKPRNVFVYYATGDNRGKFFKEFSSAYEFADEIGIYFDYVYHAIRDKRSTNGFMVFNEFQGDDLGKVIVGKESLMKGNILCFDDKMNFICEYFNSWDAIKKTGFNKDQIIRSCLHGRVVNAKFIFQYKEGFTEETRISLLKDLSSRARVPRPVEKLDKNMNPLDLYLSETQAGKAIGLGTPGRRIVVKHCKSLEFDENNQCFWRYSQNKTSETRSRTTPYCIEVIYEDGSVQEFESARSAEMETGISRVNILKICNGEKAKTTNLLFRFKK